MQNNELVTLIVIVLIITVGICFVVNTIYQSKQVEGEIYTNTTPSFESTPVPTIVTPTTSTPTLITIASTEVTPTSMSEGDNDVYTYLKGCVIRTTTYPSGSRFIT
jgi:Mn2+/Fe2+ NRAMP family transporter